MHLSTRSRSGGTPRPTTLAITWGLTSGAASPASAIATSVPAGRAPLTAGWSGTLARVGSDSPASVRLPRDDGVRLLLLWLGGIDIRLPLLPIPPLVPLTTRELPLAAKGAGA